jgi:uridine phosphorylase
LQPDLALGDFLFSRTSIGFDGLLNFYEGRDGVCDLSMERAFVGHTRWNDRLAAPYCVDADAELYKLFRNATKEGITVSAPGFYGPQGRWVRLIAADPQLNSKLETFDYGGRRITNLEMEGSALAGLARMLGHRAATICTIIAQRTALDAQTDYLPYIERMVCMALDKLIIN